MACLKAAPSTELHLLTLAPSVFIQRDAVLATIYLQPDSIISRVVFAVVCFLFFKFHASECSALFWITLNMLHGCNADAVCGQKSYWWSDGPRSASVPLWKQCKRLVLDESRSMRRIYVVPVGIIAR